MSEALKRRVAHLSFPYIMLVLLLAVVVGEVSDVLLRYLPLPLFVVLNTLFHAALIYPMFYLFVLRKSRQAIEELQSNEEQLQAKVEEGIRISADLNEVNKRLSNMFNSSPLAINALDCNGNVIMWNHAAEEMFGWREEEVMGRFHPLIPDEKRGEFWSLHSTVLAGRSFSNKELQRRKKDDSMIDVSLSTAPMYDANGQVIGGMGMFVDISEQKRMAEALKKAEEEKVLILDSMSELVVYLDPDMRVIWMNRAAAESVSDVPEVAGRHCYAVWHLRSEPCTGCPIPDALKTGTIREGEITSHDGRSWIVRANPVKDPGGTIVGVVQVATDITERKKTEEALHVSEGRFRQLFDQNEDAIILFRDKTFEVMDINPTALNLYGYSRDELMKYGYHVLMEPKASIEFERSLSFVEEGKRKIIERSLNIKKNNSKIIVSYLFKKIRLDDEAVIYCSIRDITERVRMEEDTKLIQAKLIQANKMTSLGMLVSGIAHEINNPNNYIMANATFLYDAYNDALRILDEHREEHGGFTLGGLTFDEAKKDIPRMLSGISYGSRRIKTIIDELRDFARQDRTGLHDRVDINKVIKTAVSIIGQQVKKHTDMFHVTCNESIPRVKGNAQQIEQVVINLIINSLQALPSRRHGVWVSSLPDKDPGFVLIKVRDEGRGMEKDELDRVMEPFFTTKLDSGGTGLGLSISYSIIKDHGGSLEFESQPGKGTTVLVRLPTAK